jgi:hypothetical protein
VKDEKQLVLVLDGVKHRGAFLRLATDDAIYLNDEADGCVRVYCAVKIAQLTSVLESTETYKVVDMVEGLPDCFACLAWLP